MALKSAYTFLLLLLLSRDVSAQTAALAKHIENRLDYLSEFLQVFPPNLNDTTQSSELLSELTSLLDSLSNLRRDGKIRNSEQFYLWMGRLNYYAHNLDVSGSWAECEFHFRNLLKLNPKSFDARSYLSSLYFNSWNPGDPSSDRKLDLGYSLLHQAYREGRDSLVSNLYWNMALYGIALGSRMISFDAVTKLKKYFPNEPRFAVFDTMISKKQSKCLRLSLSDSRIVYRDDCSHFTVTYPDYLTLYKEGENDSLLGGSYLAIETPLTPTSNLDTIRNSISIRAIPKAKASLDQTFQKFLLRGSFNLDSTRTLQRPGFRSYYVTSRRGKPERYVGIYTTTEQADYSYHVIYIATESTFSKNLSRFVEFENSVVFH